MSDSKAATDEEVHAEDWVCLDCGDVYCAPEDSMSNDLPRYCLSCGDTVGWRNKKTGREVLA